MEHIKTDNGTLIAIHENELKLGIHEEVSCSLKGKSPVELFQTSQTIYNYVMTKERQSQLDALEEYRRDIKYMGNKALIAEKHKSPRLAKHLNAIGKIKPDDNCEAHALVAGGARRAKAVRAILARWKIRIDDPVNGVWLPNFARNTPHPLMPDALAHRKTHTKQYYVNIEQILTLAEATAQSREGIIRALAKISADLVLGKFPIEEGQKVNARKYI